jgi:23S rRNA (adenine2503-C2)-methyltransferase
LGLNIAARKIVFSTVGIIAAIRRFAQVDRQFRLAWSLAAPFDGVRRTLVGWKGLPSIDETILALLEYQKKTKRRITIEYVLLKDLNDGDRELKELARISQKIDSHVDLIPFNSSPDIPLEGGNIEKAYVLLKKLKVNVTIRKSLGQNISAACGQLSNCPHPPSPSP